MLSGRRNRAIRWVDWRSPKLLFASRLTEGLSKKDVLRCLKRFIAREVFNDLKNDLITA